MSKEQLIKKWLDDDLNELESQDFNALDEAELYKEITLEAKRFNANIHVKAKSFEAIEERLSVQKYPSTNWIKIVSGIAAILVLSFALFTWLNSPKLNTIETRLAENEVITLPDNSVVTLNALSKLTYNAADWKENRTLDLKGEAFFDVEKGERFEVITALGKVTVLGTEFNVVSRDSSFQVSCYEGLVQVSFNEQEIKLPAGTEFQMIAGEFATSQITIAEPYWLKNMSVFENADLKDIIQELEKHYAIKVQLSNVRPIKFTGAFEHDNLENALKSVTQPLNLTYELNNNKVIIRDGQN